MHMKLFILLGIVALLTMAFSPPVQAHVLKKDTSPTEWINILKEQPKGEYSPFVNVGLDPFAVQADQMRLIQHENVVIDKSKNETTLFLCRLLRSERKVFWSISPPKMFQGSTNYFPLRE